MKKFLFWFISVGIYFTGTLVYLDRFPSPWFDEGWTLSVARNWIEHGVYGHFLMGSPAPPSLSGHFPVVALAAFGLKLLGTGLWQARIVFVLVGWMSLWMLFRITQRIGSAPAAVAAVVIVCIFPAMWDLSFFIMARQVLGEIPSVFLVLMGAYMLARGGTGHLAGACVSWAIAFSTKAQVAPFLLAGLSALVLLPAAKRRWAEAGMMLAVLAASWLLHLALDSGVSFLLRDVKPTGDPVTGLSVASAMVLDPAIRLRILRFALASGLPYAITVAYGGWLVVRALRQSGPVTPTQRATLFLAVVGGSWYLWWVTLSVGWGRYLLPAAVLLTPLLAMLLNGWTSGFRVDKVVANLHEVLTARSLRGGRWVVAALLVVVIAMLRSPVSAIPGIEKLPSDADVREVVLYLDTQAPDSAVIETYEAELLFYLSRRVHYPPAQANVDVVIRDSVDPSRRVGYDLTGVRADFLVVAEFGVGLYAPLVAEGTYVLDRTIGRYAIYRPAPAPR